MQPTYRSKSSYDDRSRRHQLLDGWWLCSASADVVMRRVYG